MIINLNKKHFYIFFSLLLYTVLIIILYLTISGNLFTKSTVLMPFDMTILELPNYRVRKPLNNSIEKPIFKIPKSTFRKINENGYITFKILFKDDKIFIQHVYLNLINTENLFAVVSGLEENDVLLINPEECFEELVKWDEIELKSRLLNSDGKPIY